MFIYVIKRITWVENADYSGYAGVGCIIGVAYELSVARDTVMDDAGYYTYEFEWANERYCVGYDDDGRNHSGVRYEIREVPIK
mgnify:CR=1 FL=1